MISLLKNILFSTRLMSVLFLVFATAMGIGTFIETDYGTNTARIWIYNSWWFELIILLFLINFIGNIKRYHLLRREKWSILLLHAAWIFIIIGAFITRYISDEGILSLREGETQNFYLSENSYITVFVDGKSNGQDLRKSYREKVLFSPYTNNFFQWKSDFKGQAFDVQLTQFISRAKKTFIPSQSGKLHLKIVESHLGERHEHWIEEGSVISIHNTLFSFNNPTEGAVNLDISQADHFIESPLSGTSLNMNSQQQLPIVANEKQPLHFKTLYQLGDVQFVLPEPPVQGTYRIVSASKEENVQKDALVLKVTTDNQTRNVTVFSEKGNILEPTSVTIGKLTFHISYGSIRKNLPFSVKLNDFIAEKYPGTEKSYASFMSKVTVISPEKSFDYDIFMNHILNYKGYRFFQASFHPDEKGTVLSVNHDYWGTLITYIGYFLLYAGLIASLFIGNTRFVRLARKLSKIQKRKAMLCLTLLLTVSVAWGQTPIIHYPTESQIDSVLKNTTVSPDHAEKFGELILQDNGRMKPISTFSSELLRKISKKDTYKNMSANQVLLSMMLSPITWYHVPFFYIKRENDSLRHILNMQKGQKYASAILFFTLQMQYKLSSQLQNAYLSANPNQFEKEFKEADQKLGLLNQTLSGGNINIFPLINDPNNRWVSPMEYRQDPSVIQDTLYGNFVNKAFVLYLESLREAINTGDYHNADQILDALKKNQYLNGEKVMPTPSKIKAEILYQKYDVFRTLFSWYLFVSLFLFIAIVLSIFYQNKITRICIQILSVFLLLLYLVHSIGLGLRWYISGHAPWSNAYESMIYVAWATMGAGFLFYKRSKLTIAATAFVTSMILMIAHWNWMDPSIGTLQPVLNSYWLMIHVAVIVGSYGPFSIGAILGILSMLLMIFTTKRNVKKMSITLQELTIVNELSLTLGLVMLTIGNFLGGQWANESWGRYWGWDPKETWALISIMIYAFVIHMRIVPKLKGMWLFNFMSVVAFASILMTYFGVNFYLSGLHSYASGEKIITPDFVYYASAIVLALGGISYFFYKKWYQK